MEDELRGIGDMARASGLSVSALRFYDRVGLLMPAAVDPVTGYRRYSADQLGVATLVAGMRRIGMPLAEITTVLEQRGDPAVAGRVLDEHLSRLEDALADARREAQRLRGMVSSGPTVPSTWPTTVASVDVDALELARAMDSVRFAVSDDPGVPELSGVLIEIQDSTVRLVATDRYRLASYEVSARRRTGDRTSAVVPARLLDEARALLDGRGDATIDLSGERIT
ncbi:MerR family transcriptional regulator, partial [Phytoactinopolyspora endophytica]|uniref:DNA polymerase III subunit beta family protein n=1 Tax=Phytoactinopolyspora endophytica TaxID=1642495 RepID=UPI00101CE0CD